MSKNFDKGGSAPLRPLEITPAIMQLFDLCDEVMRLDVSSALAEEWAKEIKDKSDIECSFYESAEDVPDPHDLSSENKNLIIFDDLLLEKQNK